jgi:hypothetical protein
MTDRLRTNSDTAIRILENLSATSKAKAQDFRPWRGTANATDFNPGASFPREARWQAIEHKYLFRR